MLLRIYVFYPSLSRASSRHAQSFLSAVADQIKTSTSPPTPQANPEHLKLLKIGSFKFPPSSQNGVQMPYPIVGFVCQMPLLKSNCRRFSKLSFVTKLLYVRGTRRRQFKMGSYFRRWLRGTRYVLRTRNTY